MTTKITAEELQLEEYAENQEWLEALDNVLDYQGNERSRVLLRLLQNHLLEKGVSLAEATLNTPYRNTIPLQQQPHYSGDEATEQKLENIIRWNAMAMVLQANDNGSGVGGHIATYQSAATMLEVGFNHYFRNRSAEYGGDQVLMQAHASPGIYARAFLEGRLTEQQVLNFRRELKPGGGLCSYPHPRRMPELWQGPTASMGLSTPSAIYQARFMKYLENRGLKPENGGKVWCFIGDGESDEPEVLGSINMAVRENLDNLVMVVNCNLQRLDGPVRGNGKIIQELERSYRGAGWNVIKVIWGSEWDPLFARDKDGLLQARMDRAVDGDYQFYTVSDGPTVRDHWVEGDKRLEELMSLLSDEEIRCIRRGGHDRRKINAAFAKASETNGRPTVILMKTVKGDGMGPVAEGQNNAHQKKQLSADERIDIGRRFGIPLSDEQLSKAELYLPDMSSSEMQYLHHCRGDLNGYLPSRSVEHCPTLSAPALSDFAGILKGSGDREQSTTTSFVRMLSSMMKDADIGRYIVPIVPDEARTFGMESLFRQFGIYSSEGQKYQAVDASSLLPYREATDGQLLQEGICETGAMASFMAAGTAYANYGVPTIPFYIFYSIFGFQRVGDMIWACADNLARGFLLGGTAGRTTLNGEGLQHQDGHSHLLAMSVPNLKSYDPAFGYETAVIVREGIDVMYKQQQKVFYYLTLYNETYQMPEMPDGVEEGILKGIYRYRRSEDGQQKVHLLGSGSLMQQVLVAADLLSDYGCSVDIWSVTSYGELLRDFQRSERENMLVPEATSKCYLAQQMASESGVFVAASDFMKVLPGSVATCFPGRFTALGTDGFGLSESRQALRDHFEVDARHIAWAAMSSLFGEGKIDQALLDKARTDLAITANKPDPITL